MLPQYAPPVELPFSALGSLVVSIRDPETGIRYPVYLENLESFYHQSIQMGIQFGVRIGAGIIMAALLFLVSNNSRSLLHVLYQIDLFMMVLDSVFQTAYLQTFANSIGEYILQLPVDGRSKALSVCCTIFFDLNVITLVCTLIVQVYAAFADTPRKIRLSVLGLCCVAAFPCVLIHLWGLIASSVFTYHPEAAYSNAYGNSVRFAWVFRGAWPVFAATVATFSAILCVKLGLATRNRVRLGLQKWEPIRIVFTMACQNSVVSAIILIATAATPSNSTSRVQLGAAALPITAVLMPIGYVWAQMSMRRKDTSIPATLQTLHRTPSTPTSEVDVVKYLEKADHRINGHTIHSFQA